MKKFYGGIFMDKEALRKMGITYPIKLEYYKIEEKVEAGDGSEIYGVEVIKTEYKNEETNIESAVVNHVSYDETAANQILEILKANQVTPVTTQDVLNDLLFCS